MSTLAQAVMDQIDYDYPPGTKTEFGPYVFYGSAGRAFMHLRAYKFTHNSSHLSLAKLYIDDAVKSLPPPDILNVAYLKGNTGIFAVAGMVYHLLGEKELSSHFNSLVLQVFQSFASRACRGGFDSGLAGLMHLADVLQDFYGSPFVDSATVDRLGRMLFENGMKYCNVTTGSLQFTPGNIEHMVDQWWIGLGVGSSGSIRQILRRPTLMQNTTIQSHVHVNMEYYLSQQSADGQVRSDMPHRVQWCHGAPGFIPVFIEAHRVFGEDKFLDAAKLAAQYTSTHGILTKGMQLGHGVSGNIYLVLELYQYTGDPIHLSQAISMLLVALKTPELVEPESWVSYDCVPGSFWVSSPGGMVMLFLDLVKNYRDLSQVSMPIFRRKW